MGLWQQVAAWSLHAHESCSSICIISIATILSVIGMQVHDEMWLAFRDEGRSLHSLVYAPVRLVSEPEHDDQDPHPGDNAAVPSQPQMVVQSPW